MTFLEKLLRRKVAGENCSGGACEETARDMLDIICSGSATEEEIKAAVKAHFRAIDEHTRRAA